MLGCEESLMLSHGSKLRMSRLKVSTADPWTELSWSL